MATHPNTFTARLIGTWDLLSYTATSVNDPSDILHPFGSDCRGRAVFSHDGYVATYIQARDVRNALKTGDTNNDRFSQSEANLVYTARKTISYSAPFRLEFKGSEYGDEATIFYEVEMSIPTVWIGRNEVRELRMCKSNGKLYLSFKAPPWHDANGVMRDIVVQTVRASPTL